MKKLLFRRVLRISAVCMRYALTLAVWGCATVRLQYIDANIVTDYELVPELCLNSEEWVWGCARGHPLELKYIDENIVSSNTDYELVITVDHSDTNIIIGQNYVKLSTKIWSLVGFIYIKVSKHTWSTEIKELNTTLWVLYHCQHSPTVNRAKHGKQNYSVYLSTFL